MPVVISLRSSIIAIAFAHENPESRNAPPQNRDWRRCFVSPMLTENEKSSGSASVAYITRIRENYARLGYKPYAWVDNAQSRPPWTPLEKPLSECRLGLVASGGIYVSSQVAFHWR